MSPVMLADFLLARIAEDEAEVRAIDNGFDSHPGAREMRSAVERGLEWVLDGTLYRLAIPAARVLAECEAKRAVIAMHPEHVAGHLRAGAAWAHDEALRRLALPYADHPDYRDEWRP